MTTLRHFLTVMLMILLTGCAAGGRRVEPAQFDLGAPVRNLAADRLSLRSVQVRAPNWIDTSAMQYRLVYAQPTRRQTYAESRWAASPAALLEQNLRQRFMTAAAPAGACRLVVELDEFIQEFSSATASRSIIEVRATLLSPVGDAPLARQSFAESAAAASADAAGGVAAHVTAAAALGDKIAAWLAGSVAKEDGVQARCGNRI